MTEYCGTVEIRGGIFKKFSKVYMECKNDILKIYTIDKTKEKLNIPMSVGIFHKKLTWLKKFPKEQEELAFEIGYDKIYQFVCSNYVEYSSWLNVIPLKMKCNEVFGVPLSVGVNKSGWRFPLPIYRCLEYLEKNGGTTTEGIFRLSSSTEQTKRVKEMFDGGQDVTMQIIGDVHVASGLIKLYLRELPDSLIPKSVYYNFLQLSGSSNLVSDVKTQIQLLPEYNKNTLWLIMRYLSKVLQNCEVNQMTSTNLCVCFSPSIFRSPDNDVTREMTDAAKLRLVIDPMITHFTDIFFEIEKENHRLGIIPPPYPAVIPVSSISSQIISDAVNRRNQSMILKSESSDNPMFNTGGNTSFDSTPIQPVMQSSYEQQQSDSNATSFQQSKSRNAFLQHLSSGQPMSSSRGQGTAPPTNGFLSRHHSHALSQTAPAPPISIGNRTSPISLTQTNEQEEVQQISLVPQEEVQQISLVPQQEVPGQTNEQKPKVNAFLGARVTSRPTNKYNVHDASLQSLILPCTTDTMNDFQKAQSLQRRVDALISKATEQDRVIYEFQQKLLALGVSLEEIDSIVNQKTTSSSPTNQPPRRSLAIKPTEKPGVRGSFLARGRPQQNPNEEE